MVFGLSKNIFRSPLHPRRTDTKSPIAILPAKRFIIRIQPMYPFAGIGFDNTHKISEAFVLRQCRQNMDMVGHTTYGEWDAPFAANGSTNILEYTLQILVTHDDARALCMKHDVNVQLCVCVCHIDCKYKGFFKAELRFFSFLCIKFKRVTNNNPEYREKSRNQASLADASL